MKNTYLLRYAGGILLFALGALASHFGVTVLSFVLFLVLAAGETVLCYREQRRILDFRILLSLSWLLAIGLSRLDLSLHQTPFSLNTWLACGLFYFGFLAAYDLFVFLNGRRQEGGGQEAAAEPASGDGAVVPVQMPERYLKRLKLAIFIVAGLGLAGFLAECVVFRFEIPILVRGISHSYSEFHISGVHYFVVSLWMVHALTVIYMLRKKCDESETMGLLILNLACFAVPVMLLSKFQILIHALL
ncbi:MAG: hypothetical protein J6U26_02250, partial [Lachnospiraceae bacterium]|nr:hypothetical protein [Lachnospiraceae bacterium]